MDFDDVAAWWRQQMELPGDATGPTDDWYGEHTEDKTHHAVVTEARQYDLRGQQRHGFTVDRTNDSVGSVGSQQPAADHVYSLRQQAPHSGPELTEISTRPSDAPVHLIHAGPRTTSQDHNYDGATPIFYETDIRPGQSVVMPGFTISIEAPRGAQQIGGDRLPQPVVTVTPAEGGGQLMTISDQEFLPQQQQHSAEHHPLAGIMRSQQHTTRSDASSEEHDLAGRTPSYPRYPGAAGSSSQQASSVQQSEEVPLESVAQQRPERVDYRAWSSQSDNTRRATFTSEASQPAIDNVQVSVGSRQYYSAKSPPASVTKPQGQPLHQVPESRPYQEALSYENQIGGPQLQQFRQPAPQRQTAAYQGLEDTGQNVRQLPSFSQEQQSLPHQNPNQYQVVEGSQVHQNFYQRIQQKQALPHHAQSKELQPQRLPQFSPEEQALPYYNQAGGPQASPAKQPLPHQSQYREAQHQEMSQFNAEQRFPPYQSQNQVGGPQPSPEKHTLPYQGHGRGPQLEEMHQSSPHQKHLAYQNQTKRSQPQQFYQPSPQKQPLPYQGPDIGPPPQQLPQSGPELRSLLYQSQNQAGGPQPGSMHQPLPHQGYGKGPQPLQFTQEQQPLPYQSKVGGPLSTIPQQSQPYQGPAVRPSPGSQPAYHSNPPAYQRLGMQQAPVQRPQSLVSHKLPMNPNFNRALLADAQPQDADAQTADGTNEPPQYSSYSGDQGAEVLFGGSGTPNQPRDMAGSQDAYGYPGKGMYMAEADGYHSLPRMSTNRGPPVRTAEQPSQPPQPPPPPPPNPFKVYGITSAGGSDPERRNMEQKVMLANSVAQSFMSPDNVNSRGQRMFLVRRQNSEKWTKSGPDPQPEDGGAWPQRAPAVSHPHQAPPPLGRPLPARQQSVPQQHPVPPGGSRLGRSTSMQGPTPAHHQGQFVPPSTPPQLRRGGQGPQGYLIPARPQHGSLPGQDGAGRPTPIQQSRNQAESFGSQPVADVRSNQVDWQMERNLGVGQQQQQQQQHHHQQMRNWPTPSQPVMTAVSSYYGVSDL